MIDRGEPEAHAASAQLPAPEVWLSDGLLAQALSNHRAGIMVNLLAALGFSAVAHSDLGASVLVWLALVIISSVLRLISDRVIGAALRSDRSFSAPQLKLALQVFYGGFLFGSSLWAAAAVFGLPKLPATAQFTLVVIVAALAGGATGVLAPMRLVGALYILLLLVPASLTLMVIEPPYWVLGGLGLVFAGVMLVGHRNNYLLLRRSFELQHQNDGLLARLSTALDALSRSNHELEERVAQRTEQLRELSRTDTLTQLLNRRGLVDTLAERDHPEAALAILFLDLDRFKQVNDGLGHEAGDVVLQEVARRFLDCTPAHGVLARWGGDEFVLAVPSSEGEPLPAAVLAERFRSALTAPIELGHEQIGIGVSIGFVYRREQEPATDLIAAADLAAAEAKRRGRGIAVPFHVSLAQAQQRRLQIVAGLRTAILDNALWLAFQPLVDARDRRLVGYEALLRWLSPRLGAVAPEEFVPVAADSERILELGDWVLRRALAEVIPQSGASVLTISINVSLRQLQWPGFVASVKRALRDCGRPASHLVLEITESALDESGAETTQAVLSELAAFGVRIHLDDFGSGYSSLSSLHRFTLHGIKIDESFVERLDARARAVIEAAVLVARAHGLQVIAEGVETEQQASVLTGLGVDTLQGFLFGRPRPGPI